MKSISQQYKTMSLLEDNVLFFQHWPSHGSQSFYFVLYHPLALNSKKTRNIRWKGFNFLSLSVNKTKSLTILTIESFFCSLLCLQNYNKNPSVSLKKNESINPATTPKKSLKPQVISLSFSFPQILVLHLSPTLSLSLSPFLSSKFDEK